MPGLFNSPIRRFVSTVMFPQSTTRSGWPSAKKRMDLAMRASSVPNISVLSVCVSRTGVELTELNRASFATHPWQTHQPWPWPSTPQCRRLRVAPRGGMLPGGLGHPQRLAHFLSPALRHCYMAAWSLTWHPAEHFHQIATATSRRLAWTPFQTRTQRRARYVSGDGGRVVLLLYHGTTGTGHMFGMRPDRDELSR